MSGDEVQVEEICAAMVRVASAGGDMEEALRELLGTASTRDRSVFDEALRSCRHRALAEGDPWKRAATLLHLALDTGLLPRQTTRS